MRQMQAAGLAGLRMQLESVFDADKSAFVAME